MKPIVKWAGGKRQLIKEIEKRMPVAYNRYFEPFIGGGALYFHLEPNDATINDFNSELINLYNIIKNDCETFITKATFTQMTYNESDNKSDLFYKMRELFNENILNTEHTLDDAVMMLFLNKCCYNGLYRINSSGYFNAPWNKKKILNMFDETNVRDISEQLKSTKILCGDFEECCKNAQKGDFVFFDSPYYDTFDTYQKNGFSNEDHIRLAKLYKDLTEKGVYCMLTNSNTDFIKELYSDYNIDIINVKRMINSDAKNRKGQEVIITNYDFSNK